MAGCGHRKFDELKPESQMKYVKHKLEELEGRIRELESEHKEK